MLVNIEANQTIIDKSHNLFTVLSCIDNLKVFSAAKDGLRISKPLLSRLGISKRRCHKALDQLKDAGLIKYDYKKEDGGAGGEPVSSSSSSSSSSYLHTTLGSIVYQRNILDMERYTKHSDKMQMIDTIMQAQKSPEVVAMFNEQIISNIIDSGGSSSSSITNSNNSPLSSSSSSAASSNQEAITGNDIADTTVSNASIILSYDNIVQLLRERIEYCKNEILIATRNSPEIIINKVLEKSKLGVKVKVIADVELVKGYFEYQQELEFTAAEADDGVDNKNTGKIASSSSSNSSSSRTSSRGSNYKNQKNDDIIIKNNNDNDNNTKNYHDRHQQERKNIIANPYYPNTSIHRRISDIPFSMIILDGNEVGIELVDSNNTKDFFAGVWIKDEKFATAMKSFYQTIWDRASENINGD